MPLTEQQKQQTKAKFNTLIELIIEFSKGDVRNLYVIDHKALLKASKVVGLFIPKLAKACWTRGKQGHGR